jgi:hypothetical protein
MSMILLLKCCHLDHPLSRVNQAADHLISRLVDTNPALGDGRGPPDESPVRGDVAEYRVVAASCKLIG